MGLGGRGLARKGNIHACEQFNAEAALIRYLLSHQGSLEFNLFLLCFL